MDSNHLDQTMRIRTCLSAKTRERLISFLKEKIHCFASYVSDMPRIDPEIIIHKLNIDLSFKPVKHKMNSFSPEKNQEVNEEVDEL